MNSIINFSEAMTQVSRGKKPSILLGNGFSRNWKSDPFDFKNLLDVANFGVRDPEIRKLFSIVNTYDFEKVMGILKSTEIVINTYGTCGALMKMMKDDQELLKNEFIKTIAQTHPENRIEVTENEFTAVRTLLSQFEQVFTVNYDLLFYWARNQDSLPPKNYKTNDGFKEDGIWKGDVKQNVHFLHGGLHIFDEGSKVKKHKNNSGTSILQQVKSNLNDNKFPLFVSEPTSTLKKQKILHNPYLNDCFKKLLFVEGEFFVFGHSFDQNDKHIFDQIRLSGVRKVFVSIFGDQCTEDNLNLMANARKYLERNGTDVVFFKSESTPVWRSEISN